VKGHLFGVKGHLFGVKGHLFFKMVTCIVHAMNDVAIYRNDYPLLSRSKPLTPKAATLEALIISRIKPSEEGKDLCELRLDRRSLTMFVTM
jgi:hypothetical protein